jgi:leucyl/phenylalanyl-tRNA---protein transferase
MAMSTSPVLSPSLLLDLYRKGVFPMAEEGQLYGHDPDPRAIFPLEALQPNARLRRSIRNSGLFCTVDRAFTDVMRGCADREETWISEAMIEAYTLLHRQGHALSVETWRGTDLVGGIYGVRIGKAFFGESMFSRETNASSMAFHHLVDLLRSEGFLLFDTQYINDHTRTLGAIEIPRAAFRALLRKAVGA